MIVPRYDLLLPLEVDLDLDPDLDLKLDLDPDLDLKLDFDPDLDPGLDVDLDLDLDPNLDPDLNCLPRDSDLLFDLNCFPFVQLADPIDLWPVFLGPNPRPLPRPRKGRPLGCENPLLLFVIIGRPLLP